MNRNLPAFLLLMFLFFSCHQGGQYHRSLRIPSSGWEINNKFHFEDSISDDMPEVLKLELNLRHNPHYTYSNIWLYIRISTSDSLTRMDTVNWALANPSGHWIGKGWGSLYSLNYQLPDLIIKNTGSTRWFKIDIQHGLRDNALKGLEDIGIRVYSEK